MESLSRRRRLILVTVCGALVFLAGTAVVAWRWSGLASTYRPGEGVEGVTSELTRPLPADYPRVVFTDVTSASGISFRHFHGKRSSWLPEDMGSGAAWGDADGDGWVDLAVANEVGSIDASDADRKQSPARAVLYHNNRDGTFTDITDRAGIDFRGWGMAVAWADYDNDGHLDLLITAYGHNALYRNNGDGTFEDRSASTGIGGPDGFWAGAAWGDYDRDGFLDLYITGYVKFTRQNSTRTDVNGGYDVENPASINPLAFPGERNLLFHNNGNGTFTELAGPVGVANATGRGLAASWVDLDDDGWSDLYVANDASPNVLYRNLGNGTFTDVTEAARISDYRSSMAIAVGDWNRDGTQDLFLTHWLAQGNALYDNMPVRSSGAVAPRSPSRLAFMDEAERYGLGQVSLDYVGWAASFIDYDNDGHLDLFIVNGSTLQSRDDPARMVPMQSKLFWNRGTADGFFDVSPVSGAYFRLAYVGRGGAFADYDHDGDIDAFVVNHGAAGVLLRNDGGNRNHWLQVGLRGTKSNRFGIGARIRVISGDNVQVRYVGAQSPYLSQNAFTETFGLGQSPKVDTIEVTWPGGARDVRTGVLPNESVVITEGAAPPADRAQVQTFWALYRQATAQRSAGETQRAAETYARALSLQEDHEDALYYAGSMRLELGDFAGARRAWQHLVEVNPASARAHSQLGTLYLCLGRGAPFQLDSAERHLRSAHEINREETGPLLHLGEVALLRADTGSARRNFAAVLATHAASRPAHFYTGYLAWKTKDTATARAELRLAATSPQATPAGGIAGEGDTKTGGAPLRATSTRCDELRRLAERAAVGDIEADPSMRYRALDSLLATARKRLR